MTVNDWWSVAKDSCWISNPSQTMGKWWWWRITNPLAMVCKGFRPNINVGLWLVFLNTKYQTEWIIHLILNAQAWHETATAGAAGPPRTFPPALRVPLYIWDDVPWSFYRELWDQEIIGFSVQLKGLEKVGARQLWSSFGEPKKGNCWGITNRTWGFKDFKGNFEGFSGIFTVIEWDYLVAHG